MVFAGDAKEVKVFLQRIAKTGIKYKIKLSTDAKFSIDSTLVNLTEKQVRVMRTAYNLEYYDIPQRISSAAARREA